MTHDSVFALLVVECFLHCAILQGNRLLIHELNLLFPCKHYGFTWQSHQVFKKNHIGNFLQLSILAAIYFAWLVKWYVLAVCY